MRAPQTLPPILRAGAVRRLRELGPEFFTGEGRPVISCAVSSATAGRVRQPIFEPDSQPQSQMREQRVCVSERDSQNYVPPRPGSKNFSTSF